MRHLNRFLNWLAYVYNAWAIPQQLGISDSHRDGRVAEQTQGHQAAADVTLAESVPTVAAQPSQRPEAIRSSITADPSQAVESMPIQLAASTPIPEKIVKEATIRDEVWVAQVAEPKKVITPAKEVATAPIKRATNERSAASQPQARSPQTVATDVKPQDAEEGRPAPIDEPKKAVTPASEVATVPRKTVAAQPSAVPRVKAQAPKKVSAQVKPLGAEPLVKDERRVPSIAEAKQAVTPTSEVAKVPRKTVAAQPFAPKTQVPQADVKPQGANGRASAVMSAGGKYDPGTINDQTAQRLARLLISEIKLYNTNKIESAGEANNIYDLLKDPIDKSRHHYRQRLGEAIETMPDYFHAELVRSLCAGDPSRLGPNYQTSNKTT